MIDTKFLTQLLKWLRHGDKKNRLNDCGFLSNGHWDRLSDFEMAEFRNHPKLPYVERDIAGSRYPLRRYRGGYTATKNRLASHLNPEDDFLIFLTNSVGATGTLLLLADIDNKDGEGDVDRAVARLLEVFRFTSCYVEPSTHGRGQHVYFLLDVEIAGFSTESREDIWTTFRALAEIISADSIWKSCGVEFDGFYGLPTIWGRINDEAHVDCRGNQLKVPQLRNGWDDLTKLTTLRPMSYEKLFGQMLERGRQLAGEWNKNKDVLGVTNASPYVPDLFHLDGFTKKRLCVDEILRKTDGHCTVDEVHADYMSRWKPSTAGDTAKQTEHGGRSYRRS